MTMALVKHPVTPGNTKDITPAAKSTKIALAKEVEAQRRKARTLAKQQQSAERIAAATAQLASAVTEAASAAEQLRMSADQIATGAQESSGAAQESLAAFKQVTAAVTLQMENAETGKEKAEEMKRFIHNMADDIKKLSEKVTFSAARQKESVKMVEELENQAQEIVSIVKTVSRIADQTNLLALNAAIEAARAGQHGKGFAVVADEVRELAESSEASAKQIQEIIATVQDSVSRIAGEIKTASKNAEAEVEKGNNIAEEFTGILNSMDEFYREMEEIASGAQQSNEASLQALKGSEDIAAAAEEQAAAAEEVAKTVEEQAAALNQSEQAAQNLSEIADDLRSSSNVIKSSEEVASTAEELASAIQEINKAAEQIMTALEQIKRGAQDAAAATEESSAALVQIESGLKLGLERSENGNNRIKKLTETINKNSIEIENLIDGISESVAATQNSMADMEELKRLSRKIDKIVESITTIAVKTSMLAVNGSIEAARAGEYGRGFAVVSTDITNLARDSAENADRIKEMVYEIQETIQSVSSDLEKTIHNERLAVEEAEKSTGNIIRIKEIASIVEKGMSENLHAAREIATAIEQVRKGIEQIAAAAQESENAAAEAAGAAEQQFRGTEELAGAVEEIASIADELQSM